MTKEVILLKVDNFELKDSVHKTSDKEKSYDLVLFEKPNNRFDCGKIVEVNSYDELNITIAKLINGEEFSKKLKIEFKDDNVRKSFIQDLKSVVFA